MPPKRRLTKADLLHAMQVIQQGVAHPRQTMHGLLRSGHSPFSHSSASRKHFGGLTGFGAGGLLLGGARKRASHPKPRKTIGHARNQARGAIVRQVMMQHGMTLPQASHYVKMHNIAY
jgi:hypothetical protein